MSPEMGDELAVLTVVEGLIVMFNALPSLTRSSSRLSTSICFLSDGDGEPKRGDWMLLGEPRADVVWGWEIIEIADAEEVVGMPTCMCDGWGKLWGEMRRPPFGCDIANWLIFMLPWFKLSAGVR